MSVFYLVIHKHKQNNVEEFFEGILKNILNSYEKYIYIDMTSVLATNLKLSENLTYLRNLR